MATHSSILAWRSCGQRSLAGYSPCGSRESYLTKQLSTGNRSQLIILWRFSVKTASPVSLSSWEEALDDRIRRDDFIGQCGELNVIV